MPPQPQFLNGSKRLALHSQAILLKTVGCAALGLALFLPFGACSESQPSDEQGLIAPRLALVAPDNSSRALCPEAAPGSYRCVAWVHVGAQGEFAPNLAGPFPSSLKPADLANAYNLPSSGGNNQTIAIVDAYDAPYAESDLGTYRSQFGLPPCTSGSGCFIKINQRGGTTPPSTDPNPGSDGGWATEIALDIQMASAICPSCKILLVEADSASSTDLGTAVNAAAMWPATVISNSYGASETTGIVSYETYFDHPGVFITVSAGDQGYGVEYPASSQYVTSVGGTRLVKDTTKARGWGETVWLTPGSPPSGTGSGCSRYIAKPSWQSGTSCAKRMVADVSAVADPATGVAVFSTPGGGWMQLGGTSASAPIVAAIFALTQRSQVDASFIWNHATDFYDVTSGSNGSCSPSLWCTAGPGYDGPTGFGTPNGGALACQSTSCAAQNAMCGTIPDGCGGTLDCGTCTAPQTCGGGGVANLCGCTPTTCAAAGANCGQMPDSCGGTLNCGSCTVPLTCGGSGVSYHCGCAPTTCQGAGVACGTIPDGCGGTLVCGPECGSAQVVPALPTVWALGLGGLLLLLGLSRFRSQAQQRRGDQH